MQEMMVRRRETVDSHAKIAMRALPERHIAKTLLRGDEMARRKFFDGKRSLKLTDRNSISRLIKMRAGAGTGEPGARTYLDRVAATMAFYGVGQREKDPALCLKSERPLT
jgi:hypothetical protein